MLISGVKMIAAGLFHSLLLMANGDVFSTGSNHYGQLGDGQLGWGMLKMVIGGVTMLAAGGYHSLLLMSNGDVFSTGHNFHGELGDGTKVDKSTPVKMSISGVTMLAAGGYHSLLLMANGDVFGTGCNVNGELGDGSGAHKSTPVKMLIGGVTMLAAGGSHSLSLMWNGDVFSTGSNQFGQLGDGTKTDKYSPERFQRNILAFMCANGTGASCSCKAGFSGTISSSPAFPYYAGQCQAVACPAHSIGTSIPNGCSCTAGFFGAILASSTPPFYAGQCQAFACNIGTGAACYACKQQASRKAENHCDTCNNGFALSGTACQAFNCSTGTSFTSCKTCKSQSLRTANDHCDTCHHGFTISGTACQAPHAFTITGASGGGGSANGLWYDWAIHNGKPSYRKPGCHIIWEDSNGDLQNNSFAFTQLTVSGQGKWTVTCASSIVFYSQRDDASPPLSGWITRTSQASGTIALLYQTYMCTTGNGSACKICKAPSFRRASDHCDSCNSGFALSGTACQASPTSAQASPTPAQAPSASIQAGDSSPAPIFIGIGVGAACIVCVFVVFVWLWRRYRPNPKRSETHDCGLAADAIKLHIDPPAPAIGRPGTALAAEAPVPHEAPAATEISAADAALSKTDSAGSIRSIPAADADGAPSKTTSASMMSQMQSKILPPGTTASGVGLNVPSYWKSKDLSQDFFNMTPVPEIIPSFQELVSDTYKKVTTRDRKDGDIADKLTVKVVMRVENSKLWQRYVDARATIKAKRAHKCTSINVRGQIATMTKKHDFMSKVDGHVNEAFLWHGSRITSRA